jgi:hypothetical protein
MSTYLGCFGGLIRNLGSQVDCLYEPILAVAIMAYFVFCAYFGITFVEDHIINFSFLITANPYCTKP